jgi:hypothetical protein
LSSTFTTALKRTPGFGLLSNLLASSTRFAFRLFRRPQNIRVETVYRGDGSRKKILIDAGLADAPSTPSPNQRGIISRRNKENKRQGHIFNAPSIPNVPGYFPLSPLSSSPLSEASIVQNADILDPLGGDLISSTQIATFDEELSDILEQLEYEVEPSSHIGQSEMFVESISLADVLPEYDNDLSELPDAPPKKMVRFSKQQKTKFYFKDGKIDDVVDSFMEEIQSTRMTPEAAMDLQLEHMSPSKFSPHTPTKAHPIFFSTPPSQATLETEGYYGIPSSTWDDSSDDDLESIEHSHMSSELLDELLSKVDITPKIVEQPPVIEPLIAPLTEEESDNLHRIATKSDADNAGIAPNLSVHDFKTLLPSLFNGNRSAWLNDQIVNEYLSIIINYQKAAEGYEHRKGGPAPPVHNFASQFYLNLKKSANSVSRWAGRKQLGGQQLLDCRLVLIPLCDANHWRLVAVKPQAREIQYLDSLSYDPATVINKIQEWLALELNDHYIEEEWTVTEQQFSQQQLNGSDCGVFACLNALALVRGEEPARVVACKGMDVARRRIAITLMKGQPTTEFGVLG